MENEKWKTGLNIELDFLRSLKTLVSTFTQIAQETNGDINEYKQRMQALQNSTEYANYIDNSVRRMVTPLAVQNMATWRKAAKKASKNPLFYFMLMRELNDGLKLDIESQVKENAELIKTLPIDTANKVVFDIEKYTFEGIRAEEIANKITKYTDKHARASARLIARTEVSKTTTALTRARSENLGLNWYIWRTALDGDRVRKSHRNMEGVLVNWSEPPSPEKLVGEKDVGNYHAGNIWNCRCYPEPIVDEDDIPQNPKVYTQGKIERMSKTKFIKEFM